jgi:hypothetical protein
MECEVPIWPWDFPDPLAVLSSQRPMRYSTGAWDDVPTADPPPLYPADDVPDEQRGEAKRRKRTPSVATLIKQAEKSGRTVSSITTADGTTLRFGEPEQNHQTSELDAWMAKRHAN